MMTISLLVLATLCCIGVVERTSAWLNVVGEFLREISNNSEEEGSEEALTAISSTRNSIIRQAIVELICIVAVSAVAMLIENDIIVWILLGILIIYSGYTILFNITNRILSRKFRQFMIEQVESWILTRIDDMEEEVV